MSSKARSYVGGVCPCANALQDVASARYFCGLYTVLIALIALITCDTLRSCVDVISVSKGLGVTWRRKDSGGWRLATSVFLTFAEKWSHFSSRNVVRALVQDRFKLVIRK